MLRSALTITFTALVLVGAGASADVYKFTDSKGNVLYTDKPATLPAERLNIQSNKTDVVAAQAHQEAEMKRMQETDRARQQSSTQQADQRAAQELTAKDKAERCTRARERYDNYMNSQRLYQMDEQGERRYLDAAELDAARNAAKVSMEELCK
ncbi:MAG TPA: DUF4124 domain-containing protein [Povalibacter sp.]|nr:DUF4124 domain-containing protein [Povalibacter sp.]